ncbi:MAG: right-handed parallel beta-helix repeat-containing protein [Candidatus Zixiibacteriota bacterium]
MRFTTLLAGCLLAIALVTTAIADQATVTIASVNGSTNYSPIPNRTPIRFLIKYTNLTGEKCDVCTGFRLTSPDGVVWDSTTLDTIGPFIDGESQFASFFDIAFARISGSRDGQPPDTIGVIGAGIPSKSARQLPAGFNDTVFAITAWVSTSQTAGKHLCIDSSFVQPGGTWTWVGKSLTSYTPAFVGLTQSQPHQDELGYCFTFASDICCFAKVKRVPAEYGTIQAAIDAAETDDTILVASGTYAENLNFKGKSFRLMSESGAEVTIIRSPLAKRVPAPSLVIDTITSGRSGDYYRQILAANSGLPVITIPAGSSSSTSIDGFTVDGENVVQGISILQSDVTIKRCIIQNGSGYWDGGGLWIQKCRPTIVDNVIRHNKTPVTGGGIFLHLKDSSGFATISDNRFYDNYALNGAGVGAIYGRGANVTRNLLVDNNCPDNSTRGGALYCGVVDSVFFINNTIVDCNFGITLLTAVNCDARNNIVANCPHAAFEERFDVGANLGTTHDYNVIWANGGINYYQSTPGANDITVDPMLDTGYALLPTSPCINAGDPSPKYNDPDGSRCDMGAFPYEGNTYPPADTLHVPSEYSTIAAAYEVIANNGLILVSPGTYAGGLTITGKSVRIKSTDGPDVTTITAASSIDLFRFIGPEASASLIEGFKLLGGHIGIWCQNSGPTIKHNLLINQTVDNWAAIALAGPGYPSATVGPSPAVIINNTIFGSANGGISTFSSVAPTIRNNIIAFTRHYGLHKQHDSLPLISDYNDVFGMPATSYNWPQTNLLLVDPLLSDAFHLTENSPCIDAGNPLAEYNDPDGTRNDIGAIPLGGGPHGPIPTNEWLILYCDHATLDSLLLSPGQVISAFDPQGILCGRATVGVSGKLGPMLVYADDPYTAADEGAVKGDVIQFNTNGTPIYPAMPVVWTENGAISQVCQFQTGVCRTIQLHTGWNLVSWNVTFDGPIETLLSGVKDAVDIMLGYDQGGLVYIASLPQFSTLNAVDHHHGYWIKANREAVLTVCGSMTPCGDNIPIYAGWNLVSYEFSSSYQITSAFYSIMNSLQVALGYDQGGKVYVPGQPQFNTLSTLYPGFGYWVRTSAAGTLLKNDCVVNWASRLPEPATAASAAPLGSRFWISVYGSGITLDGTPLEESTELSFVTSDNQVIGQRSYTNGVLRFTPVYGFDDQDLATRSFPKEGDLVSVLVNGVKTSTTLTWSGHGTIVQLSALGSGGNLPKEFSLDQNYPNPFNPNTMISFSIAKAGHVKLSVFNTLGQEIRVLTDADYNVGTYKLMWDGRDRSGLTVASGVYLYRIETADYQAARKMLLIK